MKKPPFPRKPVLMPVTLVAPDATVWRGELQIHDRDGQTTHPVGGWLGDGRQTFPIAGKITDLRIERDAPPVQQGRPLSAAVTARAVGIFLAHQALTRYARPLGDSTIGAEHLASRITFEWWKGMGVSDIRKIAPALKRAEEELGQRRQIIGVSGEGGVRTATGMQSVCFLPGAIIEIADGVLTGTGPAWFWSYPDKSAVYHRVLRVSRDVTTPGATDWKPFRRTV